MGESGSGKSVTSLAIMGLHRLGARGKNVQMSGEIWLDGQELVSADPDEVRKLRGREMAMIFQDPLSAMHPYYTIGNQIVEAYRVHHDVEQEGRAQAGRRDARPGRHPRAGQARRRATRTSSPAVCASAR